MRFTDALLERVAPVWQREFEHPFVRGLGDGSLDPERFRVWLRQDYLFLIAYARVLALASARSPDLETMRRFASLLEATLGSEMDLHRACARRFDMAPEELEAARPAPTCSAYTDFLLEVAWEGPLAAIVAALLPCALGYAEIAARLRSSGGLRDDNPYREWILTYTSPKFAAYAGWLRDLLDGLAGPLGDQDRRRLAEIFATSSEHELSFWEMAWSREPEPRDDGDPDATAALHGAIDRRRCSNK